jgi:DNA repair protein RadC
MQQLTLLVENDAHSSAVQVKRAEMVRQKLTRICEELNAIYHSRPTDRPVINSQYAAVDLLRPFISHLDHEEFWVVLLDTKNRVQKLVQLYKGTVSTANVRVAEVFRIPIIENSRSILIAHNHPSGDPTPSPEDVNVTHAIVKAGKLLEIEVLDHLVIGSGERWVSLKERGLGF